MCSSADTGMFTNTANGYPKVLKTALTSPQTGLIFIISQNDFHGGCGGIPITKTGFPIFPMCCDSRRNHNKKACKKQRTRHSLQALHLPEVKWSYLPVLAFLVSRTSLRRSWARLFRSCIALRTRLPAALLPSENFFTSASMSATVCLMVSKILLIIKLDKVSDSNQRYQAAKVQFYCNLHAPVTIMPLKSKGKPLPAALLRPLLAQTMITVT